MEKKTSFKCNNCGYCCTDQSTQINMTLLDIKWLSDCTKMSVKELFLKEIVAFVPFIRTENFSIFDVEFGMKRPCPLYKNNKCEAYDGRPMNCRIFPYWFITNKIADELECIQNIELLPSIFFKYKMYERIVGEMIMAQSMETEEFIKRIDAGQTIDFSSEPELKRLMRIYKRKTTENDRSSVRIAKKLMELADKKVDREKLNKKIDLIEKEINSRSYDKDIDMLLNAEAILDGTITDVNVSYDKDFQNP